LKATLVIPSEHTPERRFRLEPRPGRKGASGGFRVIPASVVARLDGPIFQDLRDVLGACIETDDVRSAARILQLGADCDGLVSVR
jgi:hypothetical protein